MKGIKHDKGKERWDLVPWQQLKYVAKVLTFGANKYKPDNWKHVKDGEKRYFSAALRHLNAIAEGEIIDPETGYPHHAHAICSILFHQYFITNRGKYDSKSRKN